jgi:hypothetical protein
VPVDTTRWKPIGESSNSQYFEIEKGLIAALPNHGAKDDLATARENVEFQHRYWREHGPGCVLVFFDRMVSQDKDARSVYQSGTDPSLMLGTALVGGSLLSRAMGSFFLGLSKPKTPLKMFGSVDDAIAWARHLMTEKQA